MPFCATNKARRAIPEVLNLENKIDKRKRHFIDFKQSPTL